MHSLTKEICTKVLSDKDGLFEWNKMVEIDSIITDWLKEKALEIDRLKMLDARNPSAEILGLFESEVKEPPFDKNLSDLIEKITDEDAEKIVGKPVEEKMKWWLCESSFCRGKRTALDPSFSYCPHCAVIRPVTKSLREVLADVIHQHTPMIYTDDENKLLDAILAMKQFEKDGA